MDSNNRSKSNRLQEQHVRHYTSGKATLVNEGVVHPDNEQPSSGSDSLRGATANLASGWDDTGVVANVANKYAQFPSLKKFDDDKSPYILVSEGSEATWNGAFYTLPLHAQDSWDSVFGAHRGGSSNA